MTEYVHAARLLNRAQNSDQFISACHVVSYGNQQHEPNDNNNMRRDATSPTTIKIPNLVHDQLSSVKRSTF